MPSQLQEHAEPLRFALFADFDGTLVEIADKPDTIDVPDDLAPLLAEVKDHLDSAFAVVTGRRIADIDRYLAPVRLPVAGGHGVERRRIDGSVQKPDERIVRAGEAIAEALAAFVAENDGLLLERKDGAVALHFRQRPELELRCISAMERASATVEGFNLVHGKMVIEARPQGANKGEAVRAFMQEAPFRGRIPVFIGDDTTDEDGFIAAQSLGGVGIKLGEGRSAARLRIKDVASVHALIGGLGLPASPDMETAPPTLTPPVQSTQKVQ